jgi:lysophospholipase L1-like esterase
MNIAFFGDSLTAGQPGVSYFRMLCRIFPEHKLANYGRGGDSVIGTYDVIVHLQLDAPFDMAFLWTGTNDIFAQVSWTFPIVRKLLRQPWTNGREEFECYYRIILEELRIRSHRIYAVSPWFIGEDVNNRWNQELEELARIVESLSARFERAQYIDLRALIESKMNSQPVSSYVPHSAMGITRDRLRLKQPEQVDQKAEERGLYYTLDGVHLNSQGAEIVANHFAQIIRGF